MINEGTHSETYERGLEIRRAVLGAEHVERSVAGASAFTLPMQELVIEYCWGTVWGRDGLAPGTRSLINLAMLAALNRPHELALHVRGAVSNGATNEEIQEALLQTAIYAGVPAALEAFRVANGVLEELGRLD
ncbi:4-carboxymuconolactone decarboxylase [Microbacterium ulmi]|uniref:4-carboxymuconolactone decarboxylase n=1 Tax=Microbacterium ulmi TaxID=179095 RepID=UPI001ABA426D|nr:4-carboxymuconolactone decarboxylase [Microbacterium ulmi]NII69846.1 4-carboxymuconolactone decarboxylase [Microbacterium ulmi]